MATCWNRPGAALFNRKGSLLRRVEDLMGYVPLSDKIERLRLNDKSRKAGSWTERRENNMAMPATSLAPAGFLPI